MPTKKINGALSFSSNSPGVSTGYGQQGEQLIERMLKSGLDVAVMSNYGHEGSIGELKLRTGKVPHYPRSFQGYSDDLLPIYHNHFTSNKPDLKSAIFTLYDVWVYKNPQLNKFPFISWVPIDHVGIPQMVYEFLKKPNVTPVTMAPNGQKLLEEAGIENTYIPHGINTKIYNRRDTIAGVPTREYLGVKDDEFLVGIVAANKANNSIHRKAFAENIVAFGLFLEQNPKAVLYIHSDPTPAMGGFDLARLLKLAKIPKEKVILPNLFDIRFGLSQEDMASLYSAFDVLLATSYGEGFGIPVIEAQACGTKVIASSWTASEYLVGSDSYQVDGYPLWDESQGAYWKVPHTPSIKKALEIAYESDRGFSESSREFALEFDADKIYSEKWEPFLINYFEQLPEVE